MLGLAFLNRLTVGELVELLQCYSVIKAYSASVSLASLT